MGVRRERSVKRSIRGRKEVNIGCSGIIQQPWFQILSKTN